MTKSVQKPAKAIIFARVSTHIQKTGHSLDAQVHRAREYCKQSNLEVAGEFLLCDTSTSVSRKFFLGMIEFIKEQKEPIALVCDKAGRLQRSVFDIQNIAKLVNANKLCLHFIDTGKLDNDSNSAQVLLHRMSVVLANAYTDRISNNAKRGIKLKLEKGECICKPPLGYKSIFTHRRKACDIQIDEQEASVVKQIFEMRVSGYSIGDIAKVANITRNIVDAILRNPFYYGEIYVKSHDKYYPHKYEKIIDRDLFDRCQEVRMRSANSSSNYKTSVYNDFKSY